LKQQFSFNIVQKQFIELYISIQARIAPKTQKPNPFLKHLEDLI